MLSSKLKQLVEEKKKDKNMSRFQRSMLNNIKVTYPIKEDKEYKLVWSDPYWLFFELRDKDNQPWQL